MLGNFACCYASPDATENNTDAAEPMWGDVDVTISGSVQALGAELEIPDDSNHDHGPRRIPRR